jgi:UDP-N-acetylmuramoyl-L-alanyl-D-glutamate--2,6-diaminopimelate ligase
VIRFEEIPEILGELQRVGLPPSWPQGEIAQVTQDSRSVRGAGAVFVAIQGTTGDGRAYVSGAAARGAACAIGPPPAPSDSPIPYLSVLDPRKAIAVLAARFHGNPSREIDVVGITGTNGKTTTTWLLHTIWEECGIRSAVAGTLGVGSPRDLIGAAHTTPDAPHFQESLRSLVCGGVQAVAAEVSSHALDQDRVYATRFRATVFTNLTRDHLDYHGTFDKYLKAKQRLFHPAGRGDPALCPAIVNLDDPVAGSLTAGTPDPVFGYGTDTQAFARMEFCEATLKGLILRVRGPRGPIEIRSPLIGAFNAMNVLSAYTTAMALGLQEDLILRALDRGVRVPGRMERIDLGQPFLVVVDFAHTPDALRRAGDALRSLLLPGARFILVFGCGGDRDHGKRSEMGGIAAALADRIVLTNDNPRTEDPRAILESIRNGVRTGGREPDVIEPDRAAAIRTALGLARNGDVVLIAGKGHETYQETAMGRRDFDDRAEARAGLEELGWGRQTEPRR